MTTAILAGAALAALLAFIGYAIYRAHRDPIIPRMRREVVTVPYPEALSMLQSNEGWQCIAREIDAEADSDLVTLVRMVEQ